MKGDYGDIWMYYAATGARGKFSDTFLTGFDWIFWNDYVHTVTVLVPIYTSNNKMESDGLVSRRVFIVLIHCHMPRILAQADH